MQIVIHAGVDRVGHAQSLLREAACRIDGAGGHGGRLRPDEVTDLWMALVAGRWTQLDEFEAAGRRYIVARRSRSEASDATLSDREREVAAHIAVGQSNKAVAWQLGVSPSTVASHAARIARKLGVTSRVDLVFGCARYLRAVASCPRLVKESHGTLDDGAELGLGSTAQHERGELAPAAHAERAVRLRELLGDGRGRRPALRGDLGVGEPCQG
jgi:DNA-binding CsgD family transcriptional regulator